MMPAWTVPLERISIPSAFGVRFWDSVHGAVVSRGLSVELFRSDRPNERIAAAPNQSGIFSSWSLDRRWTSPGAPGGSHTFIVEVTDQESRFVPFRLEETLPIPGGLVRWEGGTQLAMTSPVEPEGTMLPLFSSATRTAPRGTVVVRAELWDPVNQQPAAGAVLQLILKKSLLGGHREEILLGSSFADRDGRVAVLFPYPDPIQPIFPASPVHSPFTGTPAAAAWVLDVRAYYQPARPVNADLRQIRGQTGHRAAKLWRDAAMTTTLDQIFVRQGEETFLRTEPTSSPLEDTQSRMYVTAS